jgi:hypothetical protein
MLVFFGGLIAGAGLTVLLALAAFGAFTLWRVYQAHQDAEARAGRILAAVAKDAAERELQAQSRMRAVYASWLPKSRMD